ncbi:hypothetical protein D3C71_2044400 [compost metagenome]
MADQGGGLALIMEIHQQATQRRAVQQILHRRMAAGDVDRIEMRVADLFYPVEADDR